MTEKSRQKNRDDVTKAWERFRTLHQRTYPARIAALVSVANNVKQLRRIRL